MFSVVTTLRSWLGSNVKKLHGRILARETEDPHGG